jgi:uncharacterized membrane protein
MTPGTSTLVILIARIWLDNLAMNLNQLGGEVVRQTLTDTMVEGLAKTQATW